jgi:hypothetical protein
LCFFALAHAKSENQDSYDKDLEELKKGFLTQWQRGSKMFECVAEKLENIDSEKNFNEILNAAENKCQIWKFFNSPWGYAFIFAASILLGTILTLCICCCCCRPEKNKQKRVITPTSSGYKKF